MSYPQPGPLSTAITMTRRWGLQSYKARKRFLDFSSSLSRHTALLVCLFHCVEKQRMKVKRALVACTSTYDFFLRRAVHSALRSKPLTGLG